VVCSVLLSSSLLIKVLSYLSIGVKTGESHSIPSNGHNPLMTWRGGAGAGGLLRARPGTAREGRLRIDRVSTSQIPLLLFILFYILILFFSITSALDFATDSFAYSQPLEPLHGEGNVGPLISCWSCWALQVWV
jgi:hypothetical protein